jgi:hypothetical protein
MVVPPQQPEVVIGRVYRLFKQKTITTGDSPYTVVLTDGMIFIDATDGDIDITQISAANFPGEVFSFKRIDNSENIATITGSIDNENSVTLYGMESIDLKSDGSNWWII